MLQFVQKIERSIKERRDVDVPLENWWTIHFILYPITCGFYSIFLFLNRCKRIDSFIPRKRDYYLSILQFTEQYTKEKNLYDSVRHELNDLKDFTNQYSNKTKELNGGLSLFLIIITITFSLYWFIFLYKINQIWNNIQNFESEFYDKLSMIWIKVQLIKYPISFNRDITLQRDYFLYLFLSFITFGIYFLIWDYKIHVDPDNLYKEIHNAEDFILGVVRSV